MKPIRIRVDNRVRLDGRTLSEKIHREIRREFTYKNPEFSYKKAIGVPVWGVPPEIKTWSLEGDELSFARGCYRRVRDVLDREGVRYVISDERTEGGVCRAWPSYVGPPLRYYQEAGIDAAIRKQNCIVRAPTGSGKSLMAIAYAARLGLNTLVILPTVALFKQWKKDALRALNMRESELGIIHGPKRTLRPLTVAVQGTLASRGIDEELREFFGVVIVDECFVAGTPILMADGSLKPIELVRIGDEVAVGGKVTATMDSSYTGRLFQIGQAVATAEHPIATTVGWMKVADIRDHDIWYDPNHEKRPPVCGVWCSDAGGYQACGVRETPRQDRAESSLEQGSNSIGSTSRGVRRQATRATEAYGGDCRESLSRGPGEQGATCGGHLGGSTSSVRQTGRKGSDEGTCQSGHREWKDETIRGKATREWETTNPIRKSHVGETQNVGICGPTCGGNRDEGAGDPDSLQDRSGSSSRQSSGGDRRELTRSEETGERSEENLLPRVETLEGASLPGAVRFRRGRARVREVGATSDAIVFNLETEKHVYVAGGVLVHNCQKAAASTYIAAVDPFPAKYRLGVSADERRKDRKEFLTRDLFADVAYEIDRKRLETEGHVLDVEIRVVPTEFEADWFGIAEGEESEKEGVNFTRLLDEMTADKGRNELAIRMALAELEAGEQVIVLSHRREHCQAIDRAFVEKEIRSGFLIGGQDYAREFDATRAGIEAGDIRVGIGTYGALGYGVNLPAVAAGVAVTPIGSNKQAFNQVRGRLCRQAKGKSSARLYVLWDQHVYPGHLRNIASWNPTVRVLEGSRWVEARHYMGKKR